jgi:hypothetical protein
LATWLQHGAPVGISEDIQLGHWFPQQSTKATLSLTELEAHAQKFMNHASFYESFGADTPPGVGIVEDQVNDGAGWLFEDKAHAETFFGEVFPHPMGNVSKSKPGGGRQNRVIQDILANSVNAVARVPERQVLPRGVDHARDVARLQETLGNDEAIYTLVRLFKRVLYESTPERRQAVHVR